MGEWTEFSGRRSKHGSWDCPSDHVGPHGAGALRARWAASASVTSADEVRLSVVLILFFK